MDEEKGSLIEEREELMFPAISGALPTLRKAHFLKPVANPINQPLPDLSLLCLPFKSNHIQLVNKRVTFHGMSGPLNSWKSWVYDLQQEHQETWKKAGIFDAITASTYHIMRDNELIIELAERWCSETNTFFFPWGECSITLEDVMILGGFSVLGGSALSYLRITEGGEIHKELIVVLRDIKKSNNSRATHNVWMNYFRGRGGELEHVSFVVLWLSRYVFTSNSYGVISSKVFSIAVSLTRGTRIALAPAILASIYGYLRLLNEKIVTLKCEGQDDGLKLVLGAPFLLVQIWAWERFPRFGPKPISLAQGQPRVSRWHEIKKSKSGILRVELESSSGDNFLWRPYALYLKNWEFPKFYCDQEMWVLLKSEVDEQFLSFAKCLRACVLVGVECVEQYLPQRVAMQFALDQDMPCSFPTTNAVSEVPWNSYDKPLDGLKFYIPPQMFKGGVSFQYSERWRTVRTMLFLQDDCESPRGRSKKFKKVSNVVLGADQEENGKEIPSCSSHIALGLGSFGSSRQMHNENYSSCKANELGDDSDRNAQARPEDADKCKEIVMTEEEEREGKRSYMNKGEGSRPSEGTHCQTDIHCSCSSFACNEAMGSNVVGSGSDIHIRNSPSSRVIQSENHEDVPDQVGLVNVMKLLKGLDEDKGHFESNSLEQEKEKEVFINLDEGIYTQDEGNRTLSGAELLMVSQVNTLSCAPVQGEQGEKREGAKLKLVNSSNGTLVLVNDDDEENGEYDSFDAQSIAIAARISRLESMVSILEKAKQKFEPL